MPTEYLVSALADLSGDPNKREAFLTAEDRNYLYDQAIRVFTEYCEAIKRRTPKGETPPTDDALQEPGFRVMMEIIFQAGYELGQSETDHEGPYWVELSQETNNLLVQYALHELYKRLTEGEAGEVGS